MNNSKVAFRLRKTNNMKGCYIMDDNNMTRKLFNLFILCILVLVALCTVSSFSNTEKDALLTYDETGMTKLNEWALEVGGLNTQIDMIDFSPQDTNFEPYSLTSTISTSQYTKPVIAFESMHQTFTLSVNSEIIYEFGHEDSTLFALPHGGIWHLVELPISSDNIINIDIIPSDDKTSIGITEIFISEESDAFLYLIYNNATKLLISSIILIIGLTLLGINLFISKGLKKDNLILYLGLLSTNIAIWLISESNLLQFFVGNTFIIGNLPYWSIQLLFIPFIFYMDSMYTPSHKSISKYLCFAIIVNFIMSTALHITGIAYYYSTLWIVHLLMVTTLVYFISSLLFEAFAKKNNDAKVILLQISFLIFAALAELGVFYFGNNMNSVGASLQTGMLLYLLACVIATSLKLRNIWAENLHAKYLSDIAYTDMLTSLQNRHAFERDLEVFKDSEDLTKIIVTYDLNNLKYFNDNMGHQTGDNYLIWFAELAQEYLNEFGTTYRVGGDEFTSIIYNISLDILEERLSIIQDKFKTFDDNNMSGVAVGYANYDKDNYSNIRDYLHHIDECMFKDKAIIKRNL